MAVLRFELVDFQGWLLATGTTVISVGEVEKASESDSFARSSDRIIADDVLVVSRAEV